MPRVTVLMPVYNAAKYLAEAIESVLSQTFSDFELLIINDGSTDRSREIIKSFNDARIRLVDNEANIRLIATLNKGIELSKGEYIARMDADDMCLPQRLEKQVAFMDAHPDVGLCGTFLRTLGLPQDYDIGFETQHDAIKFRLFFDTHFPHPAAMIRKQVLEQHHLWFENEYIHAEDFALWNRMADVSSLAIVPEVLVLKRSHAEQISSMHTATQDEISRIIREELIVKLGIKPLKEDMDVYEDFLKGKSPASKAALERLLDFFEQLVLANSDNLTYSPDLFNGFFAEKYWELALSSPYMGLWLFRKYRNSVFHREKLLAGKSQLRFFVKAVVG